MIKSKDEVYRYLLSLFPEFNDYWNQDDNCNVSLAGDYSLAGLFAEFSQYFMDEYDSFDLGNVAEFFNFVEMAIVRSKYDNEFFELSTSIGSCFIENISMTPAGEKSKNLMGNSTRHIFDSWSS